MLPPRIQSKKTATTCIFFERGKYCPVCACASAKKQIKSLQCRFQYQPRPPENAHWRSQRFPGCLPASLPGAHTGATAQRLPKGNAGERHEKKILPMRPPCFKHIFPATEIKRQTPCGARAEDARAAPPFLWGIKLTPVPIRRCTVPPRCPASHVFASAPLRPSPPPHPVSPWHTCSHLPLSP